MHMNPAQTSARPGVGNATGIGRQFSRNLSWEQTEEQVTPFRSAGPAQRVEKVNLRASAFRTFLAFVAPSSGRVTTGTRAVDVPKLAA